MSPIRFAAFSPTAPGRYPPFNAPKTNFVIREHYQITCQPSTEVLFVPLSDGGHEWPEVADNVGFDTSREVLEFFLRHCRCDAFAATDPLVIPAAPGKYELRLCDQNFSRLFRLHASAPSRERALLPVWGGSPRCSSVRARGYARISSVTPAVG